MDKGRSRVPSFSAAVVEAIKIDIKTAARVAIQQARLRRLDMKAIHIVKYSLEKGSVGCKKTMPLYHLPIGLNTGKKKADRSKAICLIFLKLKLFHKGFPDVFNNIPDFIILQGLSMTYHAGAFGTLFDDVEHLSCGNIFHGCRTGEIPGLGLESCA